MVQGQDTRLVNLPTDAGGLGPGGQYYLNTAERNQGETFLRQAYAIVKDLPNARGFSFGGGRFEYADGLETLPEDPALSWLKKARISQRLVGPFTFTHVQRTFDGVRMGYDSPSYNVTALLTRPTQGGYEISANREVEGTSLGGLSVTRKGLPGGPPSDFRLFYFFYSDDRDIAAMENRGKISPSSGGDNIAVHTFGGHAITVVDAGPGKVDGLLWAALQAGQWRDLDHFGWAYAVEAGYQLPKLFAKPWLRIGFNHSSGDNDPSDDDHETFFQILPTARIYAQFPFYNLMNNQDIFTQLILKPCSRVTVRTDGHWLRLTESADLWYSGAGATNNNVFGFGGLPSGGRHELGYLADVGIDVKLLDQLTAYLYYGHVWGQGVAKYNFEGVNPNYAFAELTFSY
jgi:hypothetical protein